MVSLEFSVVGSFLSELYDVAKVREAATHFRLTPAAFTDNAARRAFEIVTAEGASNDAQTLARAVISAVGGDVANQMVEGAPATLVDAELNMKQLADKALRTQAEDIFRGEWTKYGDKTGAGFVLEAICEKLRSLQSASAADSDIEAVPLSAFESGGPEEENPDALFPNGWFRKGQAMFLTSVAGSGKSVITTQLCYGWALGREVLGMKPVRPLKIGIIRPEDDDEEIAEFRDSMRRGFRRGYGWSEADIAEAEKRVLMLNPRGKMGKEFIAYLRRVQSAHHFDLVVINPLQGVSGIDLAKNSELSEFCRGGIDPIIKDEKTKCGLLVIHHTNKPPSDADKKNFGKGAFAQYIGAGGQEINAWMRGMLLLMPTIEPGVYELSAVKRGNRLGWTNPPGKNYFFPTKLIRQSPKEDHMLFWHEISAVPESLQSKSFKEKRDPTVDAQELVERVDAPKTAGELRQMARETFGKQHGDRVQSELVHNFSKYGLVMQKGANNNVQIYGREEMFK